MTSLPAQRSVSNSKKKPPTPKSTTSPSTATVPNPQSAAPHPAPSSFSALGMRSPRLETRDGSSNAILPPSAYHPSVMIASTELGVYVKWALLLQEQLELVRGEHAVLLQHCERLQVDNQLLRKKLFDENPSKYGRRVRASSLSALFSPPSRSILLPVTPPPFFKSLFPPVSS